ncbi:ferrous iron transport protein A [Synergistaceae bacterium OttesenSCG-928-I11]|nr:ferrous iron transport protein A [Synergistaceae bacterium OttesenSCG-928-I11]
MQKSLDQLTPGETGTVARVGGGGMIKRRLFDMGITPGTEITLKKTAPLGDPIEVEIRGYALSVRKSEAEAVVMNVEGGASL